MMDENKQDVNKQSEWSLIIKLLIGIIFGAGIGLFANENTMSVIGSVKYLLGQFIFFTVPLVIVAFISSAISKLKNNANRMLSAGITIAYLSAIGAASFAYLAGLAIIPHLFIPDSVSPLQKVPEIVFKLSIPPVMSVMSALVLAILLGVTVLKTKALTIEKVLVEFESIMLKVIQFAVIPILPFFIATTFAELSYEGTLTKQLPVFFKIVLLAIAGHVIWLFVLYAIGGFISNKILGKS